MIEQRTTTQASTEAQDLVERAKALRPLLQKNAAKTEEERRVPEESIQAIAEAGLFRITVPRRYGGYEVSMRTKLEVSAALAEGCGSTGSLSDIRGSITISTTKQPASPWTWFGLTSTKAKHRADQTGENAFMSLTYHSTLSVD